MSAKIGRFNNAGFVQFNKSIVQYLPYRKEISSEWLPGNFAFVSVPVFPHTLHFLETFDFRDIEGYEFFLINKFGALIDMPEIEYKEGTIFEVADLERIVAATAQGAYDIKKHVEILTAKSSAQDDRLASSVALKNIMDYEQDACLAGAMFNGQCMFKATNIEIKAYWYSYMSDDELCINGEKLLEDFLRERNSIVENLNKMLNNSYNYLVTQFSLLEKASFKASDAKAKMINQCVEKKPQLDAIFNKWKNYQDDLKANKEQEAYIWSNANPFIEVIGNNITAQDLNHYFCQTLSLKVQDYIAGNMQWMKEIATDGVLHFVSGVFEHYTGIELYG